MAALHADLANGQRWLESSLTPGLSRADKRARLEKSVQAFRKALREKDLRVQAWARQGFLEGECAIAELLICDGYVPEDHRAVAYGFTASFEVLTWQHEHKQPTASSETRLYHLITLLRTRIGPATPVARVALLRDFAFPACGLQTVFAGALRLECFLGILEMALFHGSRIAAAGKWAKAKALLEAEADSISATEQLEELLAKSLTVAETHYAASHGRVPGRCKRLRDDFARQIAICEGALALQRGDSRMEASVRSVTSEQILEWEELAADDYRFALKCINSRNKELEGALLARLARLHLKTKKPHRAQDLYLQALEVGAAMDPPPRGKWYAEAVAAVKPRVEKPKSQTEASPKAEKERSATNGGKRRHSAPVAPSQSLYQNTRSLEEDLEMLEERGFLFDRKFCNFVLREWPPKAVDGAALMGDSTGPNAPVGKKQMLNVIRAYHPDKNTVYGDHWRLLSAEICKALTVRLMKSSA